MTDMDSSCHIDDLFKQVCQNRGTLKNFIFLPYLPYMGIFWSHDYPISILMADLDSSHHVDDFKKSLSKSEYFIFSIFGEFFLSQKRKKIFRWQMAKSITIRQGIHIFFFQGQTLKYSAENAKNVTV